MKLNFLRKMTRNEKAACLVCVILFLLFISASVLAAFLFGMLNRSENNFSDYRKKTDIELSDHEKAGMDAKKELAAMRNSLELAEKNREQLEGRIAGLETEIKNLEKGFGDADGLYASLNSRLEELKKQLSEKEAEISGLKNQIVSFGKSYNIDLNSQAELLNRLDEMIKSGAPLNYSGAANSNTAGAVGVYPKISLLYKDIDTGYTYSDNADTVFPAEGTLKAAFAMTVLSAASDEKAAYDKKCAELIAKNGANAVLPEFRPEYDLNTVFTYTADKAVTGEGVIKDEEFGVEYTHLELLRLLLVYGDCVAYEELKSAYGTAMLRDLSKKIGADTVRFNVKDASAGDIGKLLRKIYEFTESGAEYAGFMKEAMMSSLHTVMIGQGVSPKKIAHKYCWETGGYHDMAIVYDEHPYLLVIMTDMDAGGNEANSYIQKLASLVDGIHGNFYG
ncbi:copper amine oxidase-like domain-containing protein [Candidatus Colimorpha enterica]|mgnify:FL=1|uniref:beta-lactamase n=1 Tax=Candidatus Colimorpha enterica TaxID=3083063 RepID=R6TUA0_9BACT|nr:copper amine oxidase-like domain-containing protein [Candidatus Colimorpha enterica]